MGNTLRRTPVSFKIPDAPDYKFLNITEFDGLNITDNTFTAETNSASDCLNVYVDETNALTTRPRLDLRYKNGKPNITYFGVYDIQGGYLHHYSENGVVKMDKVIIDKDSGNPVITPLTGDIPKSRCKIFEETDKIFMLDGSDYYVTDGNNVVVVYNNEKTYIPTRYVGKTATTDGTFFEDYNLLSDKYKETYFWDGVSDLKIDDGNVLNISNEYYTEGFKEITSLNTGKPYVMSNSFVLAGSNIYRLNKDNNTASKVNISDLSGDKCRSVLNASNNGSVLFCLGENANTYYIAFNDNGNSLDLYKINNITTNLVSYLTNFVLCKNFLYKDVYFGTDNIAPDVYSIKYDDNFKTCDLEKITFTGLPTTINGLQAVVNNVVINNQENTLIAGISNTWVVSGETFPKQENLNKAAVSHIYKCVDVQNNYNFQKVGERLIGMNLDEDYNEFLFSEDDSVFCIRCSGLIKDAVFIKNRVINERFTLLIYNEISDLSNEKKIKLLTPEEENESEVAVRNLQITASGSANFLKIVNEPIPPSIRNYKTYLKVVENIYDNSFYTYYIDIPNYPTIDTIFIGFIEGDSYSYIDYPTASEETLHIFFKNKTTEPNVTVTKMINDSVDDYDKWLERSNIFRKSYLNIRYNNERWFASGGDMFRTSNNDPTYVPLSTYNKLGSNSYKITGFNIVDSSYLAAYKNDNLFLIQPIQIGDFYDYLYTESKNSVGNDGYGSPIVSVLTEIPMQVSYDGIYGLNQVKNVAYSDKISVLMSEKVNEKWLKEDRKSIENCRTINRLYWTYFILSGEKKSNIYLLDNRTNSWFYWELPINVLDVMVKDNVTNFVDINGNIYEFLNTETVNEYNPDVTEYYDATIKGKEIIEWLWKSQILPLGTINYAKKLITTTFIVSDTDENDEYGLNYKYKVYRRNASETAITTVSNRLNYIQSVTKKTFVPRFNFIQLELSNIEDDLNNNKLRLVGLSMKYELLGGLL